MSARKYTIQGFLDEFMKRNQHTPERPFCWLLGSGASAQSNIKTGHELAHLWLKELHQRENTEDLPIEKWATAENLDIPGFDYARAESFYPSIYQRRFGDYPEQGYAFLEAAMDHAEPSIGYSFLAQIMGKTPHKVAITTNFDNLIADALFIYTDKSPLVCGHESLTDFISPKLRRPLVAKIHHDLLLKPKSNPAETAALSEKWTDALKRIFENFTPIVIGYGGNDGSLMGFLKTLEPIKGGIFWCYRNEKRIDPAVHEMVEHHRGKLVHIEGFDEVMLQLWNKFEFPSPLPALQTKHKQRETAFMDQFSALTTQLKLKSEDPETEKTREPAREAAQAASDRLTKEKDWRAWELKARAETDTAKREAIYKEGLKDFPSSAELTGNFANFISGVRKDYDEAERLYRKALELDPKDADYTGNFAIFMSDVRKDYDEAERLYREALKLDPNNATHTGNFANFMRTVRMNYDVAEGLYRKALELDPNNATHTGNFASFMSDVRKDYDEAERLYRKALELDPKDATHTGNFAVFMANRRKYYVEAERLYCRAIQLDPTNERIRKNYEIFRKKHRS
jgi:tetratricopeptide (TPR) repeat protein